MSYSRRLRGRINVTHAVGTNGAATPDSQRVVVEAGALRIVAEQEVAPAWVVIWTGTVRCVVVSKETRRVEWAGHFSHTMLLAAEAVDLLLGFGQPLGAEAALDNVLIVQHLES